MATAVISNSGLLAQLQRLLSGTLTVRLFRNNVPMSETAPLSLFQACTFPGYADRDVTGLWSAAALDGVGRGQSHLFNLLWTRGAGGVPESVWGWVLFSGTGPAAKFEAGRKFETPYTLDGPGQTVQVSLLTYLFRG